MTTKSYLAHFFILVITLMFLSSCAKKEGGNSGTNDPFPKNYGYYETDKARLEDKEAPWERRPGGGYDVKVASNIHPEGNWSASLTMNQDTYTPGDVLTVAGDITVESDYLIRHLDQLEGLCVCLTARRLYDAKGNPHRRANTNMSTLLTPTGLPIEGYYPGQLSRKIGGLWTGPIDEIQVLPIEELERNGNHLRGSFKLSALIDKDFPEGYYRPEFKAYALQNGEVISLSAYPGIQQFVDGEIPEYLFETIRYSFWSYPLPVVRIGKPKRPHMIWTLFSGQLSNGTQGIVALEDRKRFAFTSNRTFQSEFVAPMKDHSGNAITYHLVPDFPMVFGFRMPNVQGKFQERRMPDFPLDFKSGWIEASITDPDGKQIELGRAPFVGNGSFGPEIGNKNFDFQFNKWGRYQIKIHGEIKDVWGHTYTGGGTYPVIVANRLTMDTSVKPGSPYFVGDRFSLMAVINPPCPANVNVRVRHYPNSDSKKMKEGRAGKQANSFGYFLGDPALQFNQAGEYVADVSASYTDPQGRLWYGAQRSAGVVAPREQNFIPRGLPWFATAPKHEIKTRFNLGREASAYRVDTPFSQANCLPQMTMFFPYHLGDVAFVGLNDSWGGNALLPLLRVEDKNAKPKNDRTFDYQNGTIFGSMLGQPGEVAPTIKKFADRMYLVTHMNGILRYEGKGQARPLLSKTSNHFPPQEYPEYITRFSYYYTVAIRPGFVVRQFVADNTLPSSYWVTSESEFHQLGSSSDTEDDLYRLTGGAVEHDLTEGSHRFGVYASMAIAEKKGAQANRVSKGVSESIYEPMGTPFPLFIAVGPGLVIETGDVMAIGGTAFPPVESEAFGEIVLPDGTKKTFEGTCNSVGKCRYPGAVLHVEQPGVYNVQQTITARGKTGGIPGTVNGRYVHFAIPPDEPDRFRLDLPPVHFFDPLSPIRISGSINEDVAQGVIHYIMLVPGCVIDQGVLPLEKGRFQYEIYLPDIQRQFKAVNLFEPDGQIHTADMMELTLFLEGKAADNKPVYSARKIVFRGNKIFSRGPMP